MRRKTVPVKNGADAMIAAGRKGPTEFTKEVNNAGVSGDAPVQLHVDASTSLSARPESAEDKGVDKGSMQTEHRQPMGLLRAAAIGITIGVASATLYLWSMERRRQDDLAWAYYRTH